MTDFNECRASRPCQTMGDRVVAGRECEPAPGCPTVDSDNGDLRAVHVASLTHRDAPNLIYELRTDREIASITDASNTVIWDGGDYMLLRLHQGSRDRHHAALDDPVRRWRDRSPDDELQRRGRDPDRRDDDRGVIVRRPGQARRRQTVRSW